MVRSCGLYVSSMEELKIKGFSILLQALFVGHCPHEHLITLNMPVLNNSDAWKASDLQAGCIYGQLLLICSSSNIFGLNCFSFSNMPRAKEGKVTASLQHCSGQSKKVTFNYYFLSLLLLKGRTFAYPGVSMDAAVRSTTVASPACSWWNLTPTISTDPCQDIFLLGSTSLLACMTKPIIKAMPVQGKTHSHGCGFYLHSPLYGKTTNKQTRSACLCLLFFRYKLQMLWPHCKRWWLHGNSWSL